ncbi:MAG: hypothetical protein Q7S40_18500 [Opitutaceae bacterium]|nr:hypothetical protein [Opitutaceae bacterium]
MPTFAELFCQQRGVSADRYVQTMFSCALHRRARLFAPLIKVLDSDYFSPDYELIRGVGQLTSSRGLKDELHGFYSHPRNRGFWREQLRMRVSVGRVTRLIRETFPESIPPFATGDRQP